MNEKRQKYTELVRDVRDFYQSRPEPDHSIYLEWCEDCRDHINLWSYWQGSLDARIMVVGQDWGCPKGAAVMDNIRAINDGSEKEYHVDPDSLTDKNLCTLRECEPFFKRLVEIVEPEIIICLGQNTFRAAVRSLGEKVRIRGYNRFIESESNPVRCGDVLVFAEAHCGYFGTVNRARGSGKDGLDLQLEDWKKIKRALEK